MEDHNLFLFGQSKMKNKNNFSAIISLAGYYRQDELQEEVNRINIRIKQEEEVSDERMAILQRERKIYTKALRLKKQFLELPFYTRYFGIAPSRAGKFRKLLQKQFGVVTGEDHVIAEEALQKEVVTLDLVGPAVEEWQNKTAYLFWDNRIPSERELQVKFCELLEMLLGKRQIRQFVNLQNYEADIGLWDFFDQEVSFIEVKKNDIYLFEALLQAALYAMTMYSKNIPPGETHRVFKVAAVSLPGLRFRLGTIILNINSRSKEINNCEFKVGEVHSWGKDMVDFHIFLNHIKKAVIRTNEDEEPGSRSWELP
eukprot:GHVP01004317.1.p1 GENE.GHVP01004317.1~~GHVP01004317.1.p1  ORF type:complete len:313 (+),score=32.96 GHVP01004317.1:1617-2555(+)